MSSAYASKNDIVAVRRALTKIADLVINGHDARMVPSKIEETKLLGTS